MMIKSLLVSAGLTGVFCAGFAGVIDLSTNMLETQSVIMLAFISGFLGSIFSQTVLRNWRGRK